MGQYYKPAVITQDGRILSVSSHDFGSGAKLTEHSWIGNEFVNTAYSLIYKSPKQVAWIGDYALDPYGEDILGDFPYVDVMPLEEFQRYYDSVWAEDSTPLSKEMFSQRDAGILDYDTKGTYLVNHSREVYISLDNYLSDCTVKGGEWDGWCMNPLPLLTACGNGQGGGDFHKSRAGYEDIGVWAFDCLEYTDKAPDGYNEEHFMFFDN